MRRVVPIIAFALGILAAPLAAGAQAGKYPASAFWQAAARSPLSKHSGKGFGTWATLMARASRSSTGLLRPSLIGFRISRPSWFD